MVMPRQSHVDGKVWATEIGRQVILRLDIATGKDRAEIHSNTWRLKARTIRLYGLVADDRNNLFLMDFGDEVIGTIDAKEIQHNHLPYPDAPLTPAGR